MFERVKSWFGFGGVEGSNRGPFFGMGHLGNWFGLGSKEDGWQRDLQRAPHEPVAARFAAVSLIADAVSIMPAYHKASNEDGGATGVTTSALSRWLRRPNAIQTPSEFWAAGMRLLHEHGNAVAYVFRNTRNEITDAYWAAGYGLHVDQATKELFYQIQENEESPVMGDYLVPARDIMHLRINADARRPMRGQSPIVACAMALATNNVLSKFLLTYLNNRSTPSYILSTDAMLTADQNKQLRAAWNEQSQAMKAGGTPILGGGLKPHNMGVAPGDDQLVENFKLSVEEIARAFRIPRPLLGLAEVTGNVEALVNVWLATSLGALVNMIEQSVGKLFYLPPDQFVEFDVRELTRMDWESRVKTTKEAVTGGLMSVDEGRAQIGMTPVSGGYGKMPTQQQQQIPLDLLHELHASEISAKLKPTPAPAPAAPTAAEVAAANASAAKKQAIAEKAVQIFNNVTKG